MSALLLALQLALAQQAPADSIHLRADSAILVFLREWRDEWMATEQEMRWRIDMFEENLRTVTLHCHWVHSAKDPAFQFASYLPKRIITGGGGAHAACPVWYPGKKVTDDERINIDNGLARPKRIKIWFLRNRLRTYLDSLAQQVPGDLRMTGARLRFALEAGALQDAWSIARACRGDDARCALLQGLVLHRGGYTADADSMFTVAAQRMPFDQRCAWTDVGPLLQAEVRRKYEDMPCADRSEFEGDLWWLADPLYIEPGNERRAEHFARKVWIALITALPEDGRQRFTRSKGGAAVIESLIRYGWPTHMYWGGAREDLGHDGWLRLQHADTAPPYVAREYTRGRLHTLPAAAAVASPLQARADHWQLNDPPDEHDWWPVEHYARDRGALVELPPGQLAMFRRRDATRFVSGSDPGALLLNRLNTQPFEATLVKTIAPDNITTIGRFRGTVGNTLIVDAAMPPGRSLIGIEIPGDSVRHAARTRFGVDIPQPLNALAGERAMSQPLLYRPQPGSTRLDADAAIKHMFGTTTLAKVPRIGIYWETYGFPSDDSVDVELQIEREVRPGFFARVGQAFGLFNANGEAVGMRWREATGQERAVQVFEGSVAVHMRSVVLDVSNLPRSTYRLTIVVRDLQGRAVTSDRTFALR